MRARRCGKCGPRTDDASVLEQLGDADGRWILVSAGMLVVMADFHVTSGSQGDLRAAIGHIPDIGPVNSVVLSPSNPQVMIRGTNGKT